ncbi:MAG: Ig-like domain-containing protein [Gemmatimonadetes bacterium]|nr:Ig-like domain-containing protein [Gemmatimonadota bacterium]
MKRKAAATSGILSGTRSWITGIITTLAALMALMVNAQNLGLSPWLGLFDPNYADRAARRIVLTPRGDTLRAIGDTAMLTATVTDKNGGALVGATLRWQSSDSSVASVDSGGTVVARSPGRTVVEVRVGEVTARAALLVRPVPARVAVAGDSARRLADGDTAMLSARVLDARGQPVAGASAQWRSTDTLVARVDSLGLVRAVGTGRAVVSALHDTLRSDVRVEVVLTPSALVTLSGDHQRALAGRALAEPVVVQAVTRTGQPVPGVPVVFTTEHGEGTLVATSPVTDARGRLRAHWTLGTRAGVQRARGRLPDIDSAFTLTAEGDPAPGNTRVDVLNAELRGVVLGGVTPDALVRVTDTLGVALAGVRVAWSTPDGGTVAGVERTDSAGSAGAHWTLGRRAGSQRLLVQVGNARFIPATTLRAVAVPGPAAALVVLSGDGQRAVAGAALKPLVAQVRDTAGNPVAGARVTAKLAAGSLRDTTLTTGADGRVTMHWTLGTKPGEQRVELRVEGAPARTTVTASGRVGPAAAIEVTAQSGAPNGRVRLVARVRDENGNAVMNAPLALAATAGTLSGARVWTDSTGRALVTWTPPTGKRGSVRIVATVSGTRLSATHVLAAP